MEDNYPKAYREVYEILKYVPEEEKSKIPQDLIYTIEKNMDRNYNFEIDEEVDFEEIILLRETKAIFAVIYRDYWANENERNRIIQKQEYDIQQLEKEKQEKYNYNDIFKNKYNDKNQETTALIEYKPQHWYTKFLNFIKKIWKRR